MKVLYVFSILLLIASFEATAQATGEITPTGIIYPRYTTANRPTGSITLGTTIFNTTLNTHQYYNGSTWVSITNATGASPWTLSGTGVHNNSGNRVGINAPKPAADLEVQGGGGLLVTQLYTVTTSAPAAAVTMPYSGTLPDITSLAGRILDPGGTGNYLTNTNYQSYVRLDPTGTSVGFRLTFESLALMGADNLVLSTSSDINDVSSFILSIDSFSDYATGRPFTIKGASIFIHFRIYSGSTPAAGFQLLFETVTDVVSGTGGVHSESLGAGISYSPYKRSFSTGFSRASGLYSTAMGYSTASGNYSTAMGSSTASGNYSTATGGGLASAPFSTAIGFGAKTRKEDAVAIGYNADCNASSSMVLSGYGAYSGTPYELVTGFKNYRFWTKQDLSTYVMLSEGSGSWTGVSDSTKKERFMPVHGESVLQKIAKLPLTSWSFKQSKERHYGPMAQDFYAAFGQDALGTIGSDTTINSGDFDGVNLIAIQALEKRTKNLQSSQEEQIASMKKENAQLIAGLMNENAQTITGLKNENDQLSASLRNENAQLNANLRSENAQLAAKVNELQQSLLLLYKKHEELLSKMEGEKTVRTDPE